MYNLGYFVYTVYFMFYIIKFISKSNKFHGGVCGLVIKDFKPLTTVGLNLARDFGFFNVRKLPSKLTER
jgi:hypothetical protein